MVKENDIGKLSVIIPVYNVEKYLEKCVESICSQTYSNLEIILVDDGSVDNSPAICDSLKEKDTRIQVLHQKNRGTSSARNTGLHICTGDFITFVDSDDELAITNGYESSMMEFLNQEIDLVVMGSECNNQEEIISNFTPNVKGIYKPEEIIPYIIYDNLAYGGGFPWNKIWRKAAISEDDNIIKFDESLFAYEDKLWMLQNLQKVKKVSIIEINVYRYFSRVDSLSHNEEKEISIILNGLNAYDRIAELYRVQQPKYATYAHGKQNKTIIEHLCMAKKIRDKRTIKALRDRFLKYYKWVFSCNLCSKKLIIQTILWRVYFLK